MNMNNDQEIFENKTFKKLCQDIYERSESKKTVLETLISQLRPMINNINDALMVVPLIQKYIELGVKNDDQLVKLAAIFQRLQASKIEAGSGEALLSDEEKEQLLRQVQEVTDAINEPVPTTGSLKNNC